MKRKSGQRRKKLRLLAISIITVLLLCGSVRVDPNRSIGNKVYVITNSGVQAQESPAPETQTEDAEPAENANDAKPAAENPEGAGLEYALGAAPYASMLSISGPRLKYANVSVDGDLACTAPVFGDTVCMTLTDYGRIMGVLANNDSFGGVSVKTVLDGAVLEIGDRCIRLEKPLITVGAKTYYPLAFLCEQTGLSLKYTDGNKNVNIIKEGNVCKLKTGSAVYKEADLYWLSRIVYAEAGAESLDGMIAVGNVILNRVESDLFPNSIIDVIFDKKHAVQFTPTMTGGINNTPSELAVMAAKLALEGVNISGDSLYFVNPTIGLSDWFRRTRTFVVRVGNHDFYS
ncbi:MAG: cell wall hydrolase [Ruminococcaceae bacterium]|nr:cell wall hydrolase [Oscillospiraceae bacterium]